LSWQACVQLVHDHTDSTSDDRNRHSNSCKMATILEEETKEDVHSVERFYGQKKFKFIVS